MKKIVIFLIFMFISGSIYAQRTNHEVGLFFGAKYIEKVDQVKPSLGLNYEYKFSNTKPMLGVGMMSDITLNENIELNGALALYIHPTNSLRLFIAPGVYYVNYGVAPNDPTITYIELQKEWGSQIRLLMQVGAQYDFKINMFYLSPFVKFEKIEDNFRFFLGVGASYKI